MEPLQNVIASLRREIQAALATGRDLPAAARLEPERVTLSLKFSIQEEKSPDGTVILQFGVPPPSQSDLAAHTMTVDFKVAQPQSASPRHDTTDRPRLESAPQKAATLDSAAANQLEDSLTSILGTPGFDSSARATVFRESLSELSDEQANALGEALRGPLSPDSSPAMTHAGHLLNRLLVSGPAGAERGRAILAEVLHQHSVPVLVQFVKEKWKTQMEWLG
jgi:hypothetical protein